MAVECGEGSWSLFTGHGDSFPLSCQQINVARVSGGAANLYSFSLDNKD